MATLSERMARMESAIEAIGQSQLRTEQWMNGTCVSLTACQKEQAVYKERVDTLSDNQKTMSARLWGIAATIISLVLGMVLAGKVFGSTLLGAPQEITMFDLSHLRTIAEILGCLAPFLIPLAAWLGKRIPQMAAFEEAILKKLGGASAIEDFIIKAKTMADLPTDDAKFSYVAKEVQALYLRTSGVELKDNTARTIVQWVYNTWKKNTQ